MVIDEGKPKYNDMNLLLFQAQFRSEDDCQQWLFILVGQRVFTAQLAVMKNIV
jgi:hypothetical protein